MLLSVLVGKAAAVFTALTLEQRKYYKTVKGLILKAYELVLRGVQTKIQRS